MSKPHPEKSTTASRDLVSATLAEDYLRQYPDEAVKYLEGENPKTIGKILDAMEPKRAGSFINRLTPTARIQILRGVSGPHCAEIFESVDPVKMVVALSQLKKAEVTRILESVSERHRRELVELMNYPPDSAWHYMDGDILTFQPSETAGEALQRLRASGTRNTSRFYLVNADGILSGVVRIRDIALATPDQTLGELAQRAPAEVTPIENAEEVMRLFDESKTSSIPVVTSEGRLLGAIRYEGLVNAAQGEALDDLQSMVGGSPDERALSSPFFAVRKRLPWMQINLSTAFLEAAVVEVFEGLISEVTALAVLLPVVAGQSGNTGAQALAVTLRSLTLKEVRLSQWFRLIRKEALAGLINGLAVAVVTGLGVWIWSRSLGLVAVIGFSMVIAMIIAGCAGAAVPMVLKSLKQDPAQSSSIILTTVTDVFGFFSLLGLATLLSRFLPTG